MRRRRLPHVVHDTSISLKSPVTLSSSFNCGAPHGSFPCTHQGQSMSARWPRRQAATKRTGTQRSGFVSTPEHLWRYSRFTRSRLLARTSARQRGFWQTNQRGNSYTWMPQDSDASRSSPAGGLRNGASLLSGHLLRT
jgi:hypothetical protein